MKKLPLLIALCLFGFIIGSHAQVSARLGVKAGPNFANVDAKSSFGEKYNSRTGFHAGAFATFKFTKLAVQPELIFSKQGSTIDFNGEDLDRNYSYFNIPVMLKLYLLGGLNLQVGPQFGFLASAKGDVLDGLGNKSEEDIKDELKGSEISLGLGAGWDLPFGLTVDARYNLGLSDINDNEASPEAKNQVFQVSIGYRLIQLGK
ncbi:hypothetical protein C900_00012 [Fulvivirga imtechensis AK7]|uniref:Outer membrane protein beta-barrel domain-containing protein n=1 Tax=Fulvivirga imtechensis AK7 TaxID=1237149 RepID=L8K0C7_9BACT|nr:outer membrane beta-barrel protein [Fulvivirga imtechensis]ELR73848.1 hypothetical protein C900_00012 [Fulvivirga imtechensis AK7]